MKFGISKRYALWFSALGLVILLTVLSATILAVWGSARNLQQKLSESIIENLVSVQKTTMLRLADYLGQELFTPLSRADIASINHTINDLREGLPITSVRIADSSGKILTDGSPENRSYGAELRFDWKGLETERSIVQETENGRRVIFRIAAGGKTAGYGEITFSGAIMKRALNGEDARVINIWHDFRNKFVGIVLIWTVFIIVLAIILGIVFSRTLSRPLLKLRDATLRVAKGDFAYRIDIRSNDEIGELAASFNNMTSDLEARTSELRKTNQALKREIIQRRKAEKAIHYHAYHDTLTGLPNRMLLTDRLSHEISDARKRRGKLAVFFLDLDRFKNINDALGHDVGDGILKQAALRLSSELREVDTIARIGGDEFNIILTDISHADAAAEIAHKILRPFDEPFRVGNHAFHISTSIGISIYPDDGEYGDLLIKKADIALYKAKEQGGNGFQFYNPEMNTATLERMILENSLRKTLERDELVVFYQPRVDIKTGKIVSAEALLRWNHREMGLLDPSYFIPLADEIGFITVIDEWVLRTACRQIRLWELDGGPPVTVSVNLSARLFQSPDLAGKVLQIIAETGVSPDCLEIEITETLAMSDVERTAVQLRKLMEIGVNVSIDDFGTGYSSLNYLKRLPIGHLKIDKSFIHDLVTDPGDRAIIQAVTAMAHRLKMRVIAEGVETLEQLSFLGRVECDEAQGFLISKPVPAEEFRNLSRLRIAV